MRDPTHTGTHAERGKPVALPAVLRAGKALRKGSREDCGERIVEQAKAGLSWAGEGLSREATLSYAKAGRLPQVVLNHAKDARVVNRKFRR